MTMSQLHVARPLTSKCGLTLPNRLAKAAMAENMADKKGLPTKSLVSSYGHWADGGWGMVITVPYHTQLETWKLPTIVQISHPGRQSPMGAGTGGILKKSIAPSAIPMDFGGGYLACAFSHLIFGTPKEMSTWDIEHVVSRFVNTARLSAEAGFSGVELHAAQGYLLAQFLSNKSNKRIYAYGGSPAARTKIIVDIISGVCAAIPKNFCVGIKLNSVDYQHSSALNPELPENIILNPEVQDQDAKLFARRIRQTWLARFVGAQAIGAGAETSWYSAQIQKLA